jgi:hypothetical protein
MKSFIKKSFTTLAGALLFTSALTYAGNVAIEKTGKGNNILSACPTFTFTTKTTNVSCYGGNNGAATAVPSGGTAPYTYSWTGGTTKDSAATNLAAGSYTVTATDFNGCMGTTTVTITQPTAIQDSISAQTNDLCYGNKTGSATVGAKGGTPIFTGFYNYSWKPSGGTGRTANTLGAGTYTVYVTDNNGCKDSAITTITQPTAIKDTIDVINVACKGGKTGKTITVASGGTPGYTYTWAPSGGTKDTASNLAAGTYTVTIKDKNGCTATKSGIVTQPANALTISATSTVSATCGQSNGAAYATVAGGNTPYGFAWTPSGGSNDTAKGLAAGNYTVSVTDSNGCNVTASASVANNSTLAVSITSTTNITPCYGGSNGTATATATGGTLAYTYSWSNGATTSSVSNLSAGTYTVNVTDAAGCITNTTVTITQPNKVTDTVLTSTTVSCNGGNNGAATVTTAGGSGTYTYLWTGGLTTSSVTGLAAGIYSVTATDGNGCSYTTVTTIAQPKAIRDSVTIQTNVACYGNTNGRVTIGVSGGTPGYTYSWAPGGSTRNRVTGGAGTYTVTIKDANGCSKIDSVTITQPASALSAKITDSTLVACFGSKTGQAIVTATGGTPLYNYTWAASGGTKDTASGLGAGTYTVTVKDGNNCTTTASVKITQPATAISATSKVYPASCGKSNGSAMVTATGGTPGYTYNWTPAGGTADSAFGLGQGIYTCTITDANGCTSNVIANVPDSSTLAVKLVSSTNVTPCFGDHNGTVTFRPSGGTPGYTYGWTPYGGTDTIATGLSAQTYTFTITDTKGCKISDTVTITRPPLLTAVITYTNVTCNAGTNGSATVKATGGVPAYTYSWAPSGGSGTNATGLAAGMYTVTVTDKNGCITTDSVTINQPTAITDTIVSTNITCFGSSNGSATVTADGGTPAYRYTWAPGGNTTANVTNLAPGTYTVTIRDANFCTATANVTITQPTELDINAAGFSATCYGVCNGQGNVIPSGGTTPYQYSWSNGATTATVNNLCVGTYTVTVTDAHGCTHDTIVTIAQPSSAIADSAKSIAASCGHNNGDATVFGYGGTSGYTYNWNTGASTNSINNVIAGTYTCTVTDANGCSISPVVIIADSSTLAANIGSVVPAMCNGACNGMADVLASSGSAPYTYLWSPGGMTTASATDLCAGKVSVTVTDSKGCVVSDTVTINQPAPLTVIIDSNVIGGCSNSATAVVSGGTAPYTYSWNTVPIQTTSTASGLCFGTYSVTVTDANNCTTNGSVTITPPTSIAQVQNTSDIKIYPVPTSGMLNIRIGGNGFIPQSLMIFDMTGRKLIDQKISMNSNVTSVNLSTLEQGTYILKLMSDNGTEKLERITVVK